MHEIDELMFLKDLSELSPIEYCIWYARKKGRYIAQSEAKQAAADYAALVARVAELELVLEDTNAWLIRTDREGTAHQRALAAALDRGKGTA